MRGIPNRAIVKRKLTNAERAAQTREDNMYAAEEALRALLTALLRTANQSVAQAAESLLVDGIHGYRLRFGLCRPLKVAKG